MAASRQARRVQRQPQGLVCWQPHWHPCGEAAGAAWQPQVQVAPGQGLHAHWASMFMVWLLVGCGPEVVHEAHSGNGRAYTLERIG